MNTSILNVSVDLWPRRVIQADHLLKCAGLCNTESEARDLIGQGRANIGMYRIRVWHENINIRALQEAVVWIKDGPARRVYL